jgi:hypothetical protein
MRNCDNCGGNRVSETAEVTTMSRKSALVEHGTRCNDCGATSRDNDLSVVIL